jgi:hypothetical protein
VSLFIATRGASHPWLTVPTVPDQELSADVRRTLRALRAVCRANAAAIGQSCALRAIVLAACPDTKGRQVVALVVSDSGRIGKTFPGRTLAESAAAADAACIVATDRLRQVLAVRELAQLEAEYGPVAL